MSQTAETRKLVLDGARRGCCDAPSGVRFEGGRARQRTGVPAEAERKPGTEANTRKKPKMLHGTWAGFCPLCLYLYQVDRAGWECRERGRTCPDVPGSSGAPLRPTATNSCNGPKRDGVDADDPDDRFSGAAMKDSIKSTVEDETHPQARGHETCLRFGLEVALEAQSEASLLTVTGKGKVVTKAFTDKKAQDVQAFRVIHLRDPSEYRAIRYGDSMWLQVRAGSGEGDWRTGSVLGARVHQSGTLPVIPLDPLRATERTCPTKSHICAGEPIPIPAFVPRASDSSSAEDPRLRTANRVPDHVGRWTIWSPNDRENTAQREVRNGDAIFFEQNLLYLSAGAPKGDAGATCRAAVKVLNEDDGRGERDSSCAVGHRGIWKLRIVSGMRHFQSKRSPRARKERALERAKDKLERSKARRERKRENRLRRDRLPIFRGESLSRTTHKLPVEEVERADPDEPRDSDAPRRASRHARHLAKHISRCGSPERAVDELARLIGNRAVVWTSLASRKREMAAVGGQEQASRRDNAIGYPPAGTTRPHVHETHAHPASVRMRILLDEQARLRVWGERGHGAETGPAGPQGPRSSSSADPSSFNDTARACLPSRAQHAACIPAGPSSEEHSVCAMVEYWKRAYDAEHFLPLLQDAASQVSSQVRYERRRRKLKELSIMYGDIAETMDASEAQKEVGAHEAELGGLSAQHSTSGSPTAAPPSSEQQMPSAGSAASQPVLDAVDVGSAAPAGGE